MCGISGYISCKGKINVHLGAEMISQLVHRGPDDGYVYWDNNIFLGVRRLAVVNPKNGIQPAFSRKGNVVAIFNGEIYNHLELKSELQKEGERIRDGSDVQIIPNAYLKWGMDFPSYFNGHFAIIIWDTQKEEIVLARDRVGIKPLYYATAYNGDFIAASELKALLTHPECKRELDLETISQICTIWTPIDSYSPIKGIKQIKCGTACKFDKRGNLLKEHRYWDIPFSTDFSTFKGTNECAEAFREEISRAVRLRLRADVEVGTYTSGGIDSSVIAYVVRKEIGYHVNRTFSVSFDNCLYDESNYQRVVSDYLQLQHSKVRCSYKDIYNNFSNMIYYSETPLFRTAPLPMFLLSKKVKESGLKVILTGEGADEVAWGYDIYREAKIRRFWSRFPDSNIRPQLFRRLYAYLPQFQNPRYFNLIVDYFKLGLTETNNPFYTHITRFANSKATHNYFSKGMKNICETNSPLKRLEQSLPHDFNRRSMLEKCQYLEMKTLLAGYLLSSQGDRMQSANGIEGRFPFLDHHVIGFLANLPEEQKLNGLKDKFILREAYKDFLPHDIVFRQKFAFRAPEMEAFVDDRLGMLSHSLSKKNLDEAGLFDTEKVNALIKRLRILKANRFSTRDNLAFIQILSSQIFYDNFINNFHANIVNIPNDYFRVKHDSFTNRISLQKVDSALFY